MISCRGLTKRYGELAAVDDLSFEVASGGVCAFLGPNGAGKSTTLRMLTGLITPDAGDATVADVAVAGNPVRLKRLIGVLPENLGLFDALTVAEHLEMAGPIYGLSRSETASRAEQLLRALDLEPHRRTFAGACSNGTRKKTALALALLHNPRVLFLDEPFEGIDPVTSRAVRDLLSDLARRGVTVFLTSHILAVVADLADRILMIRQGRLVWDSPVSELPGSLEQLYFELVESPRTEDLPWLGYTRS